MSAVSNCSSAEEDFDIVGAVLTRLKLLEEDGIVGHAQIKTALQTLALEKSREAWVRGHHLAPNPRYIQIEQKERPSYSCHDHFNPLNPNSRVGMSRTLPACQTHIRSPGSLPRNCTRANLQEVMGNEHDESENHEASEVSNSTAISPKSLEIVNEDAMTATDPSVGPSLASNRPTKAAISAVPKKVKRWAGKMHKFLGLKEPTQAALEDYKKDQFALHGIKDDDTKEAKARALRIADTPLPDKAIRPAGKGLSPEEARIRDRERAKLKMEEAARRKSDQSDPDIHKNMWDSMFPPTRDC